MYFIVGIIVAVAISVIFSIIALVVLLKNRYPFHFSVALQTTVSAIYLIMSHTCLILQERTNTNTATSVTISPCVYDRRST